MHASNANRLGQLRREQHVRVIDVAAHISKDQSLVHRYENGQVPIPDDVKAKLAELFGVTRSYLMGWDEDAA